VNRKLLTTVVVLAATALVFAKSTKLVMSWKNPSYTPVNFHRVLALGVSNKVGVRADFEDALAAQLTAIGYESVPGNSILLRPPGVHVDLTTLKEQLQAFKIEAVVVSRLVKVDETVTYQPGAAYVVPYPYYNNFYGYYGAIYPVVYGPDYLKEEKKVRIETNVYLISGSDGQLVWTGITDTFNPTNVDKAIKGLVKLVVAQMQKEDVLKRSE
jgi:hypothetical protein